MPLSRIIWQQLRNITSSELIRALERDGWTEDPNKNATRAFVKGERRVVIHYHAHSTYGQKTLEGLLEVIDWDVEDLQRLRFISKKTKT